MNYSKFSKKQPIKETFVLAFNPVPKTILAKTLTLEEKRKKFIKLVKKRKFGFEEILKEQELQKIRLNKKLPFLYMLKRVGFGLKLVANFLNKLPKKICSKIYRLKRTKTRYI